MKKPVILLVDDDRAVLAALEAALRPAFEEIARVEAFDDPREVLEALAQWQSSGRQLAVAVVDQRMPALSGVELLVALREGGGTQTAHLESALLTGYADLDAALDAKNAAGVARFLEKPWTSADLVREVGILLARHVLHAETGYHFVLREVTEADEIRAHAALGSPPGAPLGAAPAAPDAPDAASNCFSLFRENSSERVLVGTLRATAQAAAPTGRLATKPGDADGEAVAKFLRERLDAGERAVEIDRVVVQLTRSTRPMGPQPLTLFLSEGAVAFALAAGFDRVILTCPVPRALFFENALGFEDIPGTHRQYRARSGAAEAAMHGDPSGVPAPYAQHVTSLAARMRRTGGACVCPVFPTCLPGPYESGEFGATDLFCAFRAREMLG